MSRREDENDRSHYSSGGTALAFTLCAWAWESDCSRGCWRWRELESDRRRLLSYPEWKHVTHLGWVLWGLSFIWFVSHMCTHMPNKNLTLLAHSSYGMHPVYAVFTHLAFREDGKSLHALAFINIYQRRKVKEGYSLFKYQISCLLVGLDCEILKNRVKNLDLSRYT